ncbi:MAG TPA: TetR/AcrR family transcriptional regulator, partial [Acidimicrobiales bacterium]
MPSSAPASRAPTRWVGLAPEERAAERRTLLLDAAFELLGTEGTDGTTVRAVCQAARLNPRYFYESFDDLDACIVAVYDRLVEQLGAEL